MRVVIAPDKFKGSPSAPNVAWHLEAGLQAGYAVHTEVPTGTDLEVIRIPVADGGEGTLDAAVGSGFTRRSALVSGPTGQPLRAEFAVRGREAVIEMAAASGLAVLPGGGPDSTSANRATSLGTGELIRAALDAGCRQNILGIGGSANTDGGAGVLQGLGAKLLDADGRDVSTLDNALANFVQVLANEIGPRAVKAAAAPGAGAAGGVGYAAIAVLAATRRPGIDVVLEFTELGRPDGDHRRRQPGRTKPPRQNTHGHCPGRVQRRRARDRRLRAHYTEP
ncbi:glycerate kinase [Arthrobacter sp. UYCu723]